MGFGGGGGGGDVKPVKSTQTKVMSAAAGGAIAPVVQTPTTDVVTPAVARDIGHDTQTAQQNQSLARSRLSGIRSTWASARSGRAANLGS